MGKSTKTGNQAVSGITGTSTTKPTTSVPSSSGSSGSSGGTKTTVKTTTKTSSSTPKSSSSSAAAVPAGPTLAQQIYNAYSGGVYDDPSLVDVGAGGVTTSGKLPAAASKPYELDTAAQAAATREIVERAAAALPKAEVDKIDRVDITEQLRQLQQLADAQRQQAVNSIDYAVNTGSEALRRVYEDALPQYQSERNRIAADEATALDNQVLYAARRGDRGGIGQEQYGSIQNTAAANRTAVNGAQVKLYTDTARQISDLRDKGEFEKADKVLAISQDYTAKLMDLEKWQKEKNIGVDEFNVKLDQWKAEYDRDVAKYLTDTELDAAKLTGAFSNGAPTAQTVNDTADRLISAGKAMLSAGLIPSTQQLAAMGWTPEAYQIYRMQNATY